MLDWNSGRGTLLCRRVAGIWTLVEDIAGVKDSYKERGKGITGGGISSVIGAWSCHMRRAAVSGVRL